MANILQGQARYPVSIRALHWLSALLIIGLVVLGILMTPFDTANPQRAEALYFYHKSFGILALIIFIVRVINRRGHSLPSLPTTMPAHEKIAAKLVHILLYVWMFALPITGYVQSSSYEFSSGVHFFFIDLLELVDNSDTVFSISNIMHRALAYSFVGLIFFHIVGAFKHRFMDKLSHDVLNRIF